MRFMGKKEPGNTEPLEFKPGRKPKEAIEGDVIRFLYSDYDDDSVSWLQGRLNSRIDKLETAVESGWLDNRFKVDMISIITHWGNPKPPPISTTVNLTNKISWALGMKVDPFPETDDARNVKIHLGYMAATSMNLVNNEHISGEPSVDSSFVTSHTYEIYLHPPGEGLKSPGEEQSPPNESEVKMKKDEPLATNPTLLDEFKAYGAKKGILTLITQRRIIRQDNSSTNRHLFSCISSRIQRPKVQ